MECFLNHALHKREIKSLENASLVEKHGESSELYGNDRYELYLFKQTKMENLDILAKSCNELKVV